jgi:hypothetical protein
MEASLTPTEFWELMAFFKIRSEQEEAARKKAEREAKRR